MSRYAADTGVSTERSRSEIESTLRRYGATSFVYGWDQTGAAVAFQANGRHIRFLLPLPSRNERQFTHTPARNTPRSSAQVEAAWEQACRQRWRALALVIKAKLEAVEAGISSFETEFLPHTVLPSGETVADWLEPQVAKAYEIGSMPPLLQIGPAKR